MDDSESSRRRFEPRLSSASATFDVIGDHWMLLLLDEVLAGVSSWSELAKRLKVSPSTLSKRLGQLIAAGCVEKAAGQGRATVYQLTEAGKALFPIIAACDEWRLEWDNPGGFLQPRWIHHCGQPLRSRVACAHCDRDVVISDTRYQRSAQAQTEAPRKLSERHFRNSRSAVERDGAGGSRFLQVMGDRRTVQIMAAFYQGHHRFDEFEAATGLHPAIISDRLRKLQLLGMVHTRLYQERPDRYLYSLSSPARALYPMTLLMMQWGDRWVPGADRDSITVVHNPCGETLHAVLKCRHCGQPVRYADVVPARSANG